MKKILISFMALALTFGANAQAVSDNAVIPVSVSLTGILRLNVVSGGNIEFVVNTLNQYQNGIKNTQGTDTKFTVSSSTDFDVTLAAEDATFIGADNPANLMPLDNVSFVLQTSGTGQGGTHYTVPAATGGGGSAVTPTHLSNTAINIVKGAAGQSAGDSKKNAFTIHWSLNNPQESSSGSLLSQNLAPDRYSTNVFLTVVKK